MADQKLTGTNIKISFLKIKELIESLPESTFRADAKLAEKKNMADAALVPLENFLNTLAEIQDGRINEYTCIDKIKILFAEACGRDAKIDAPEPG